MEFTRKEKLAIFHALDAILLADGFAHKNEVDLIAFVNVQFLNFLPSDMNEARKMNIIEVANALRSLSSGKKEIFKELAFTMAEIDGNSADSELRVISLFFALLN
jgi:hypothetical protein